MVKKIMWSTAKLKDICDFIGGGTPSKEIEAFWRGNIPWISSSDLTENSIWQVNITRYITQEAVAKSATQICPSNSILVVSRVGVGKVAIAPVKVCTSQDFTNLVSKKHDACFLAYFIQSKMKIMAEKTQGTSIKGVTVEDIAQIEIKLPPKEEQTAIAEALSDVDKLISSLQKLIEKKKAIKQGTMQELLTGKKRLPGFGGEWSRSRLGGMTEIYSGGTPSTTIPEYWGGTIPWMSSGELNNKKIYDVEGRITQEGMKNSSAHLIPQYCVLVGLAGQGKTRGTAAYNYISLCTNQSIAAIYPNDKKFDSLFLYYIIDSMYESLRELSSGDGGRGGLTKGLISNLTIYMPEVPEQQAIAQVLSDMDNEIEQLKKKLDKYQQIKQGMMQELLTGRIRLVDTGDK